MQDFAAQVAENVGYKSGGDLVSIVNKLGGTINYEDWESARETGSMEVRGPQDFVINLSPLSGGTRARFTIAHELGHYILHSNLGARPLKICRDGEGRLEWEANWFAAGFLMPAREMREKMAEGLGDAELAVHFDVSEAAAKFRRESL